MILSMTGFGRASGPAGSRFSASVSIRSVNHRYLETNVRLPEAFWEIEPLIRSAASERFERGKLDVTIRIQRIGEPRYEVRVNGTVAGSVIPELRRFLREYEIPGELSAGDILRIPDLVSVEPVEQELDEAEKEDLLRIAIDAMERVREMRAAEGVALRNDIEARLKTIRARRNELASMREAIRDEQLESYRQRVGEIARAAGVEIDADRLAQETVIMVEKGDVAEELTRLEIHLDQTEQILTGRKSSGKKLDFLSQEMLREINTLGQKSRSAEIRSIVVELKTEVERIREQVQNVE
ncbi:MAG: YicC/YloC family endoribonuclease [Thermoanaerobaculia bacterium]